MLTRGLRREGPSDVPAGPLQVFYAENGSEFKLTRAFPMMARSEKQQISRQVPFVNLSDLKLSRREAPHPRRIDEAVMLAKQA